MANTSIEWTDKVWNPTRGCNRISPGCGGARGEGGCYAERMAARFSGPGQPYEGFVRMGKQGPRWTGKMQLIDEMLDKPLHWRKPARIFVNSMSDLFHEGLNNEEIAAVFGVMAACPQHTFQVLTKRADRMQGWFAWLAETATDHGYARVAYCLRAASERDGTGIPRVTEEMRQRILVDEWPLPNAWIGVSVEDQERADLRIPHLLQIPAAVRFLSVEPQLGPVDLTTVRHGNDHDLPAIDMGLLHWVIVGGESGPGARPFNLDWARSIVEQCRAAGVACFVKQMGAHPVVQMGSVRDVRVPFKDKKGGDPLEWPEELRCQEFPEVRR